MMQIGFAGGYGWDDIGDESMLTSDMHHARQMFPQAQLIAFSDSPERTNALHAVKSELSTSRVLSSTLSAKALRKCFRLLRLEVPNFHFRVIPIISGPLMLYNAGRLAHGKKIILLSSTQRTHLHLLNKCSLVWNVGGGNLNSVYPRELYSKVLLYLLCHIMKVPVLISGQTIGPFTHFWDRMIARIGLNTVELITTRDEERSKMMARDIGVTKPQILDGVDDAFDLEPAPLEEINKIYSQIGLKKNGLLVAINLRIFPNLQEFIAPFADFLDNLVEKYNANFVYIPTHYLGKDDDRQHFSPLKEAMRHPSCLSIVHDKHSDRVLKGLIGQADLAIGVRYHFVVFAVTMGVPAIGLFYDTYYEYKQRGILQMMGLSAAACPTNPSGLEKAKRLIEGFIAERSTWSAELERRYRALLPKREVVVERVRLVVDRVNKP
jgi:polysaccharide pyruvyl transferase WcaK-like protein